MNPEFYRLSKGTLIYGLGGVLQRFIGLLLLPFFTRVLSPDDYGAVALISLIGVALTGLLTLGTGNSMGMLYFREDNAQKRPTVIWTNFLLMVSNCTIWYVILYFFAPTLSELMFRTDRYAELIQLAFLGTIFNTITDPWLAYLRMEEKAKKYVVLNLVGSMITICLSIYLVLWMQIGVLGIILGGTLGSAFSLILVALVVGRMLPFGFNKKLCIPLLRIGFPSIFGLFAFLLIDYADRQMIERMLGLANLGIYSIGYSFGMIMNLAMSAFATAWPPFFMSYVKKHREARQIFGRVLTYYVFIFGSLTVLFFFVAKPVVLTMTAPAFHEAWVVVGLVAAAYALKGCYLIVLPGIYFAEKLSRISIIEWIAAIINILINLWLIPIYGILGAAIATFTSYLMLPILAWLVARNYLVVDYQWKRLAASIFLIVSTSIILYQLSNLMSVNLLTQVCLTGIVLILFSLFTYSFLLTANEKETIRSRLKP